MNRAPIPSYLPHSPLSVLLTVIIGIALSMVLRFGVAAFYEDSSYPVAFPASSATYPGYSTMDSPLQDTANYTPSLTPGYMTDPSWYQDHSQRHARNSSIILMALSLSAIVISLMLLASLPIVGDGILLGGIFTMLYTLTASFILSDNQFQLILAAITLGTVIAVTYRKFLTPPISLNA